MDRRATKDLLAQSGLAPHRKLGQNFLVDPGIPRRIVDMAGLAPEDRVLEVGVGLGALTKPLAAAAKEVIGIEADSGIIRLHEAQGDLPDNVHLVHADILEVTLADYCPPGGRLKIVANLPYSISTPFLFRLLEQREVVHSAVLMLQKEVAERLAARPGNRDYGAPTVLLAACADTEALFDVAPECFHPRPRVQSQVIRLSFCPEPARIAALGEFDRPLFTRIVRAAFSQRRKTLVNALSGLAELAPDKTTLAARLAETGIAANRRAETLELADYVRLAQSLNPNRVA